MRQETRALDLESVQDDAHDQENPADDDADPDHLAGELDQPEEDEDQRDERQVSERFLQIA